MKNNEYKCALCKRVFTRTQTDKEANTDFGVDANEVDYEVCDDCYQEIIKPNNQQTLMLSQSYLVEESPGCTYLYITEFGMIPDIIFNSYTIAERQSFYIEPAKIKSIISLRQGEQLFYGIDDRSEFKQEIVVDMIKLCPGEICVTSNNLFYQTKYCTKHVQST